MQVGFSDHALARVRFRRASKTRVLAVLRNPDHQGPSYKERQVAKKDFNGKILEVIFKREGDNVLIITAFYIWK